jgi:hypothetical protein
VVYGRYVTTMRKILRLSIGIIKLLGKIEFRLIGTSVLSDCSGERCGDGVSESKIIGHGVDEREFAILIQGGE